MINIVDIASSTTLKKNDIIDTNKQTKSLKKK